MLVEERKKDRLLAKCVDHLLATSDTGLSVLTAKSVASQLDVLNILVPTVNTSIYSLSTRGGGGTK